MAERSVRIVDLCPNDDSSVDAIKCGHPSGKTIVSAVIFPRTLVKVAKAFWQHSGDGISSRRAEYCHKAFEGGRLLTWRALVEKVKGVSAMVPSKGPRRYRKADSKGLLPTAQLISEDGSQRCDCVGFVEERFGRNLDATLASSAKLAIRKRIAGALTANVNPHEAFDTSQPLTRMASIRNFSEDDVYLYPCGMSSIFNTHRCLLACRGEMESVSFGSVIHLRSNDFFR